MMKATFENLPKLDMLLKSIFLKNIDTYQTVSHRIFAKTAPANQR